MRKYLKGIQWYTLKAVWLKSIFVLSHEALHTAYCQLKMSTPKRNKKNSSNVMCSRLFSFIEPEKWSFHPMNGIYRIYHKFGKNCHQFYQHCRSVWCYRFFLISHDIVLFWCRNVTDVRPTSRWNSRKMWRALLMLPVSWSASVHIYPKEMFINMVLVKTQQTQLTTAKLVHTVDQPICTTETWSEYEAHPIRMWSCEPHNLCCSES